VLTMDVNGSRFHLLLGKDDWLRCRDAAGRPLGADGNDTVYNEQRNEVVFVKYLDERGT